MLFLPFLGGGRKKPHQYPSPPNEIYNETVFYDVPYVLTANTFLSDELQHTTYSDLNMGMERTDFDGVVEECFSSRFVLFRWCFNLPGFENVGHNLREEN